MKYADDTHHLASLQWSLYPRGEPFFELHAIKPSCNRHDRAILRRKLAQQNGSTLQATFAKNYTRNQWEVGEVSLQEKFVARKVLRKQ